MAPLRVLIVGAGIGGPALAFWLGRQGHQVMVVERHGQLRASGQQLDLRAQGVEAVRRMGLLERVRKAGVKEDGVVFVDKTGRERAAFMATKTGTGKQSFSSEFEIMRGNLCTLLYDASLEGKGGRNVKYVWGTTVEDISQDEGSPDEPVRVRLSDGTTAVYDLVVGADGQGSRTRRIMLGLERSDKDVTLSSLGFSMAFFTLPREPDDTRLAVTRLAPGRRFVLTRGADSDKTIQVYYALSTDNPRYHELEAAMARRDDVMGQRRAWASVFADAGHDGKRISEGLVNSETADDFYTYRALRVTCPSWHRGRVGLVGDASTSLGPNGLGTSTSIIAAYIIAGELERRTDKATGKVDVQGALAEYERIFRPFMDKLSPAKVGNWLPQTELGIAFFLWVVSWICFLRIDKLLFWLAPEDRGDGWKIPEYPELKL